MARQDFLDGGYYGKLGKTVGQRWKGKYYIRTWVKPKDPESPAQLYQRKQFALATRLAQEAMLINGHDGLWDTSKSTEFNQRVSLARRRLAAGKTPEESLPLYPEGYTPSQPFEVSGMAMINGHTIRCVCDFSPLENTGAFDWEINYALLDSTEFYTETGRFSPTSSTKYFDIVSQNDISECTPCEVIAAGEGQIAGSQQQIYLGALSFMGRYHNLPHVLITGGDAATSSPDTCELTWARYSGAVPTLDGWSERIGTLDYNSGDFKILTFADPLDLATGRKDWKVSQFQVDDYTCPFNIVGYVGTYAAPKSVVIFEQNIYP